MPTKNLLVLKKGWLSLAIAWTAIIAFLCLVSFNDLPSVKVKSADKYVHATFHFIFVLLWGLYVTKSPEKIKIFKILKVVAFSIGYGILIEILQELLTTTRHADIYDVLANLTGALLGLSIFALIKKQKTPHHPK